MCIGHSYTQIKEEEKTKWDNVPILEHMEIYYRKGFSKKEAMKAVATDRGVTKRDIYKKLLELK